MIRMAEVVNGMTTCAQTRFPSTIFEMKKRVMPLNVKLSAVENFIVTQVGKMLLRTSMSRVHPSITTNPVSETTTAKARESPWL